MNFKQDEGPRPTADATGGRPLGDAFDAAWEGAAPPEDPGGEALALPPLLPADAPERPVLAPPPERARAVLGGGADRRDVSAVAALLGRLEAEREEAEAEAEAETGAAPAGEAVPIVPASVEATAVGTATAADGEADAGAAPPAEVAAEAEAGASLARTAPGRRYDPSVVASLLEEELHEEEASAPPPSVGSLLAASRMIDRLGAMAASLEGREALSDAELAERMDAAAALLTWAGEVLDALPSDDPEAAPVHADLVEAYLKVYRPVQAYRERHGQQAVRDIRGEVAARRRSKTVAQPRVTRAAALAPRRRGGGRRVALGLLTAGVVAAGVVLQVQESTGLPDQTILSPSKGDGQVAVEVTLGEEDAARHARGAPAVLHVRLILTERGGLEAVTMAMDPDGPPPRLTYTWFKNGKRYKTEHEGRLPPAEVTPLSTYKVSVTATDGTSTTRPVETRSLVVPAKDAEEQ